jgi:hypothetical protein
MPSGWVRVAARVLWVAQSANILSRLLSAAVLTGGLWNGGSALCDSSARLRFGLSL